MCFVCESLYALYNILESIRYPKHLLKVAILCMFDR